ncbi:DUF1275 domain-containing protein [Trebonia kvetii]|uniref:DUF1275 domain-containing protein n=1 Tax=Trebonia kvetii TaxID=2480626 RepID=A0A6P2C484_9ACTN|nr:YoaK family protein [Trebonia kvetii]TVZ05266.1 DUF1275 domain-containing protein [Trebonia kvetii]
MSTGAGDSPGRPAPAEPRPASEHGLARSLFADPRFGPLPALLVTLTVVTGVVDAVSILALGRVFVANMTGNVVFAAFALVGAPGFSLSASLFALAGFLVGAYAGGLMIARSADRGALLRTGTAAEVLLAAVALLIAALSGDPGASHGTLQLGAAGAFGAAVTDVLACLLAGALGIQNAVARKLAVPDMTTTVLTMTLTGLGADLRAGTGPGSAGPARTAARAALARRLLVVAAMVAGGAAGATLALRMSPLSAIALATALLAVAALGATTASRGGSSGTASWRAFPAGKG